VKVKNYKGRNTQSIQTVLFICLLLILVAPLNAKEHTRVEGQELNLQISADNNDVVEGSDGSFYLSSFDGALFGHYYWQSGVNMSSFYRWVTKGIKQGETIHSATLTLYLKQNTANNRKGISTKFYGISEDNTPVFSTDDKPSLRPITKSNVIKNDWSDKKLIHSKRIKQALTTPITIDVTTIVQEIVARSGFSEGNAIAIAHINNESWDAYAMSHEFSTSPAYAPKLKITYGDDNQCKSRNNAINNSKNCPLKTAKVNRLPNGY
jgi:hypothetical protein